MTADDQPTPGTGGDERPEAAGESTGPTPGKAGGTPRTAVRIAVASVVVTGLCAGGVALFGAAPSHHRSAHAAPARDSRYTDGLGSPPDWPSAGPSVAPTLGVNPASTATPHPSATVQGPPAGAGATTTRHNAPARPAGGSAAKKTAATPTPAPTRPTKVGGQVSCTSGQSVEGVWVEAAKGSGWAPWKGLGNGSTSDYWYALPVSEPYSLHVGCGGTTSDWAVSAETPTVGGTHNSFDCIDVAGQSGYRTCRPR